MKKTKLWEFVGQNIISLATILFGVVILFLDQFRFIDSSLIPSAILAIVALLATSELIETKTKLTRMEEKIQKIDDVVVEATKGIRTVTFDNTEDALNYGINLFKQADSSILQLAMEKRHAKEGTQIRERYVQAREKVILQDRIEFRYIGLMNDRRIERMGKYILSHKLNNLGLGFIQKSNVEIPMPNFQIFDRKVVFIRFPGTQYIAIHNPVIAVQFATYFEKLWEKCAVVENESDYADLQNKFTGESS